MFSVKATYRNETRRFSFPESVLFPTYEDLRQQLHRIFPISHNYYLSRLIFSPDVSKPGRILIGKEVHSAEDYDTRVAPLRRQWPNPLLRFTIFDGISYDAPSGASQRLSLYSAQTITPSDLTTKLPSPVVPFHNGILPPNLSSCIPPPSLQSFALCVLPPPPPPCKTSPPSPPICFPTPSKSCSAHGNGTAEIATCCSITKGKADIQVMLSSFKEDLERILCRTLGTDRMEKPSSPDVEQSACRVPDVDVTSPVGAGANSRWCFVCKTSFIGVWYGCVKCPWHAICPSCFSKSHSAHTLSFGPSHVVQQHSIECPSQVSAHIRMEDNDTSANSRSPAPTSPGPVGEPAVSVHRGVLCDSCDKIVVGVRHKCLDCPDYDLCTTCVKSGATEQHNPFHEFFEIETPGRVYVHTVRDSDRNPPFGNRQQFSNWSRLTATRHEPTSTPGDGPVRHPATCNLCDSAIMGERYKCVVCPDFDTCSSCFRITVEQHPHHGFVKVNKLEDLMIRDSIPLRQVAHLAICDSCQKTIRGARYKCMHQGCPDFDLCSDCEALPIPVHPLNHPLLKLKTSDAVIPSVYRAGQTEMIDKPAVPKFASARSGSGSPILSSYFPSTAKSPEPKPVVVSGQISNATPEDQMPLGEQFLSPLGSPASHHLGAAPTSITIAPSHLLVDVTDPSTSPPSSHPALDIYHQLWPRVNQEMLHLNATEAREVGNLVTGPSADAIPEPVSPRSLVAELLPDSPTSLSGCQEGEHHGTCPVSPVPSTKSIVDGFRTPSSTPLKNQELNGITQQLTTENQQERVAMDAPRPKSLDAVLVGDANVPDGQIFPPGAEFVKGWHVMNNGGLPWPPNTEVQFVAGEMFATECNAALRAKVGVVHPGQDLDIWTGDLKAPDAPGRYVGYWRLSDGQGNFFGSSVWIDLTVADHHSDQVSEQSLAASSMVMPTAHSTNLVNAVDELHDVPQPSFPSTKTVTDEVEDPQSDISSVSLVSVPTSDDEDAEWQDTRTHSEPLEYVVLYDSNSEE